MDYVTLALDFEGKSFTRVPFIKKKIKKNNQSSIALYEFVVLGDGAHRGTHPNLAPGIEPFSLEINSEIPLHSWRSCATSQVSPSLRPFTFSKSIYGTG